MKSPEASSYLLQDDLTGDWIIVAPGRRHRPEGHGKNDDPFSPKNLERERILKTYALRGFPVIAVENNFPVLQQHTGVHGRQEILVEGSRVRSFTEFSPAEIRAVFDVYAERADLFRRDPKIKFMVVFKNEGQESGASQPHPHSQIFGLSFVPQRARHKKPSQDLHAHALSQATPQRIVYRDKHVIAFANPTGRFAYEVRIVPKRRIDNITQTTPTERLSLAKALHRLFPLVRERKLAFNYFFHDIFSNTHEPFEIRFAPRGNRWGGFELDAGIFINAVPAEVAAEEYRKAKK